MKKKDAPEFHNRGRTTFKRGNVNAQSVQFHRAELRHAT